MRGTAIVCALALLAGCAEQQIRDRSGELMREAKYEEAVGSLDRGVKRYPESPLLKGGLIQSRNEALSRLLAAAAVDRAAGRLKEAEDQLQRALAFDTGGKRVNSLLAEIQIERRQREALAAADAQVQANNPTAARRILADALKDNPRQPDLLILQRRLEAEARRAQVRSLQAGLAETKPISLDFRDANLRTVLDLVSRNSGINFIFDKDIRTDVRVTVFLRGARVEDAIDLIVSTHQLAKKVVDAHTILIYPNTPEKQREHQEQVVRVFYLANAEAKGAAAFLRSMLKLKDPFVDERSNMLALRDSADNIELAERLIALYDTHEPEVLLELEVLEVRTSRLNDLGIKFPDTVSLTPLATSGSTSGMTLDSIRGLTPDRVGLGVAGLLISLKREVGDFNMLANPRIRARNKEKAKILIGDKVPVITATTSQSGFVADSVNYLDVGLKLEVEPTVFADDDVAIKVGLEVSSLAREVRTSSGSLAYQIGTRNASTALRLRDGETQMLAGLISNDERMSASRVPGLGDLPLAGRLFSSQRDQTERTELVLAITPRVIRNLRRPDASETELWVGTDASPRIRAVGGQLPSRIVAMPEVGSGATGAAQPAAARQDLPTLPLPPPAARETPAAPSQGSVVLQWKGPESTKVGEVFSVALEINSNQALRGAPIQLRYDAQRLQLLDVEEGGFFGRDGAPTSFTKQIDAASGVARAGVLRNQASGSAGAGSVVVLKFKGQAAGVAEIGLMSWEPVTLGQAAPTLTQPAPKRIAVQ